MKSSNLALSLEYDEARPAAEPVTDDKQAERHEARERRPRRSLDSRPIVIRDQGFEPFRVR